MHCACGLGVLLTMRMDFLKMSMPTGSAIVAWIAKICHAAYCLKECYHAEEDSAPNIQSSSFSIVSEFNKIGILLNGLPPSYQTVIVSITGIPLSSLNFEDVVIRLMNEEGRQWNLVPPTSAKPSHSRSPSTSETQSLGPDNVAMVARPTSRYVSHIREGTSASRSTSGASRIKCHKCGGVGHFCRQCPTPDSEANAAFVDNDEDFATAVTEDAIW